MNTELLREDETCIDFDHPNMLDTINLLRHRLIEEREKNADLNRELNSLSDALAEVQAELVDAVALLRRHNL